jgi:hypothetical protein
VVYELTVEQKSRDTDLSKFPKRNGGGKMKSVILSFVSYLLSVILASVYMLDSQKCWAVGGISNSKVVVPSTESVEKGRFEIEPFFGLVFMDDSDDTVQFEAGGRFTLGVLDNLEIGANVGYLTVEDSDVVAGNSDFGDIEAGLKYRFLDQSENLPFTLAYQGGITFPTSGGDAQWVFELGGLILTRDFTEEFSMDADFVIALIEDDSFSMVTDVGFGYFVRSWFQPVIEAAYSFENPDDRDNIHVFNVTAGFTSPVTDYLTIIIGVTADVHTENADEQIVLSAAFTFLF